MSWVTLNAFLKFNVKVDAAFLFLNAVFKFLCIDYNKNCHPADVRCSSTVNKMNVQIRYSLSKNLRRAVAGLYKKFSILGVWCKVQTTVLFKNEWELGMMLSRSVFLKLFLSFFFSWPFQPLYWFEIIVKNNLRYFNVNVCWLFSKSKQI